MPFRQNPIFPLPCRWAALLLVFILAQAGSVSGQNFGSYRSKKIIFAADTLMPDSLTLIPGSVRLFFRDGNACDTLAFRTSENGKFIVLDRGHPDYSKIKSDTLVLSYRVFPLDFSREWKKKDRGKSGVDNKIISNPFTYVPGKEKINDPFNLGTLNKEGSITRGLSFGNSQDVVVNSSMNLQLSGKISEEVDLLLSATDDNIPFQPDGTTAQLQEFDRIFIQLSDKNNKLIAGDFDLRRPDSYFMNFSKKGQGLYYHRSDSLSNPKSFNKAAASMAVSRGKWSRNVFMGVEGNQGPYRLTGAENELFIIIISGSEQIYIDGELLKRGLENDYFIDYNSGELFFTPNRQITKDKRIVAEFQYSDKLYARSMVFLSDEWKSKNAKAYIHYFSEQDSKNKPLQQDLNNAQKQLLASVGDSLHLAFVPSADSTEFNNAVVLYQKKDTLVGTVLYPGIFVYSTAPELAHFRVNFTFVGAGKGNYIPVNTPANGRVYRWVAPDPITGALNGTYEPKVFLISPKKRQLVSAGGSYEWQNGAQLKTEVSYSEFDINTFSDFDKKNDAGYAGKAEGELPVVSFYSGDTLSGKKKNTLVLTGGYEYVSENFSPIERFRSVEFDRDWNRNLRPPGGKQEIFSGGASIKQKNRTPALYRYSRFGEGSDFLGNMHETRLNLGNRKFSLNGRGSYLDGKTTGKKFEFLRGEGKGQVFLGKATLGLYGLYEHNLIHLTGFDSLSPAGFDFNEWEVSVGTRETAKNFFRAAYKQRLDKKPFGNELRGISYADHYSLQYALRENKTHQVNITGTYRNLKILNPGLTGLKPEETILGRIEYGIRTRNGAVSAATFYEVGSGLEQRKEFSFIEVPAGQGLYMWIDYNNNNIKELNEFEISPFPDQARYIRVFLPTNDYIRSNTNQFSQTVFLGAPRTWAREKGIKKLASYFSNQANFRTDRKNIASDLATAYNPFLQDAGDQNLQSMGTQFRNTFWINKASPDWSADYTFSDQRNKILLANGFDTRLNQAHEVNLRWNITRAWAVQSSGKLGEKSYASQFFPIKNFRYSIEEVYPKLIYQKGVDLRIAWGARLTRKENAEEFGGQKAEIKDFNLELRYNTPVQGTISLKGSFLQIAYNEEQGNPAVTFELLEGFVAGNNITWGLLLQRTLANNLQLNLSYDGRKPGNLNIVHIGSATLRAFF